MGIVDEMKPSTITFQLTDHSLVKPKGILEDVLIRVDKFILLVDLVILEIHEDSEIPIIWEDHSFL